MFPVKLNFKRKDYEHPVDVLLNLFDTAFIPGPEFWGYIIKGSKTILLSPLSYTQVKAGIID